MFHKRHAISIEHLDDIKTSLTAGVLVTMTNSAHSRLTTVGFSRTILIILVCLISVLCIISGMYFVSLQATSASIADIKEKTDSLTNTAKLLNTNINDLQYPGTITTDSITDIKKSAKNYSDSSTQLSKVIGSSPSSTIKSAYKDVSGTIASYQVAVDNIIASIESYNSVVLSCSRMNNNLTLTATQTTALIDDCASTIDKSNVQDGAFEEQFFATYRELMTNQATNYRKLATTTTSTARSSIDASIQQTIQKIFDLHNQKIDYSLPPITDTLDTFLLTVNSQN